MVLQSSYSSFLIFAQVRVSSTADHEHHLVEDLGEPGQP